MSIELIIFFGIILLAEAPYVLSLISLAIGFWKNKSRRSGFGIFFGITGILFSLLGMASKGSPWMALLMLFSAAVGAAGLFLSIRTIDENSKAIPRSKKLIRMSFALVAMAGIFMLWWYSHEFDRRERVAAVSDGEYDFEIFERSIGYYYHPLGAESGRHYHTHYWVEVEKKNRATGATELVRADLFDRPGADPEANLPYYHLGTSKKHSFWAYRSGGYCVLDLRTAKLREVACDPEALAFSDQREEAVDDQTIRRTGQAGGIYEISPTGARLVGQAPKIEKAPPIVHTTTTFRIMQRLSDNSWSKEEEVVMEPAVPGLGIQYYLMVENLTQTELRNVRISQDDTSVGTFGLLAAGKRISCGLFKTKVRRGYRLQFEKLGTPGEWSSSLPFDPVYLPNDWEGEIRLEIGSTDAAVRLVPKNGDSKVPIEVSIIGPPDINREGKSSRYRAWYKQKGGISESVFGQLRVGEEYLIGKAEGEKVSCDLGEFVWHDNPTGLGRGPLVSGWMPKELSEVYPSRPVATEDPAPGKKK